MEVVVRLHGHKSSCRIWVPEGRDVTTRRLKVQSAQHLGVPVEWLSVLTQGAILCDNTRPLQFPTKEVQAAGTKLPVVDMEVHRLPRLPNYLARCGLSDLASVDKKGRNALLRATDEGDHDLVGEMLLQAEMSEINICDSLGETALHIGARRPSSEGIALALLACGLFTEVNSQNLEGCTALHIAAAYGCIEICSELLQRRDFCQAHARTRRGQTALHYAAANNHAEACKVLTSIGGAVADPMLEDYSGRSSLDVARPHAFQALLSAVKRCTRRHEPRKEMCKEA